MLQFNPKMNVEAKTDVISKTDLLQAENTVSQAEELKPKNKDLQIKFLKILVVVLVILLAFSIYIILSNRSLPEVKPKLDKGNTAVSQELIKTSGEELLYQKDGELWFLNKTGESKQITSTNQGIYSFDQTTDGSVVAFVSGEKTTNPNNYTYVIPNAAYVYFADKGKAKKIYELAPKNFPNSEYSITIKDVGVSKDGSKVAVTTSDSLLVYDVSSEKLETIFSLPIAVPQKPSGVFAYDDPIFSPDNTKIVFRKGFYEGSSSGFVDLTNNNVQNLPYQGYISGQVVLGWLDNSSLVIEEYEGGDSEKNTARIKTAELLAPGKSSNVSDVEGYILSSYISSNKVYAVVSYQKANYDVYPGTGTPYYENYFSIYEFDLQTRTKKEFHTIKQEVIKKDAVSRSFSNLRLSPEGKKLYISGQTGINNNPPYTPKYAPVVMVLDLETGGEPVEIVQNASF